MQAVRNILRVTPQVVRNVQQRNMSAIGVPPRTKVSKGEMIVLSSLMIVGWCAVPAWVLVNIKKYRHLEE